jgi:hypothetical protein
MDVELLIGWSLLLFGVVKICLSMLSFSLPASALAALAHNALLSNFFPPDKTLAGLSFDGALAVFGVYSIVHGTCLLRASGMPAVACEVVADWRARFVLFAALGTFLFVVYYLAVFTDVPMSKMPENRDTYAKTGFLLALTFIASAICELIFRV